MCAVSATFPLDTIRARLAFQVQAGPAHILLLKHLVCYRKHELREMQLPVRYITNRIEKGHQKNLNKIIKGSSYGRVSSFVQISSQLSAETLSS
jgi:hypothetical protein